MFHSNPSFLPHPGTPAPPAEIIQTTRIENIIAKGHFRMDAGNEANLPKMMSLETSTILKIALGLF